MNQSESNPSLEWQEHIDAYRASSFSKADYCSLHDISRQSFEYHYRRWYETSKAKSATVKPIKTKPDDNIISADFSPVFIKDEKVDNPVTNEVPQKPTLHSTGSGVELQLNNGIRCKVEADFCQTTLKQVMEVLG